MTGRLGRDRRRLVGLGRLHRLVGIDQPGALLFGGRPDVVGGADDDLLDDRGRGARAAVTLAVGLDHQRRLAGRQRRRLAGAAECQHRRRIARIVEAVHVHRGVRRAQSPVELARCDRVDRAPILLEAARTERADVVVEIALDAGELCPAVAILEVDPVGGARAHRQDLRVGRRRSDRARDARVAARDDDGRAGSHRVVVGLLEHVEARRVVGVVVAAERLVEDVDVVGRHRVVDCGEDRRVVALVIGEGDQANQARARRYALDPDIARAGHGMGAIARHVVDLATLRGDRAGVAECLLAAGLLVRAPAGEVLVVREDGLTVGADEVGVRWCRVRQR